jgi:hypothetical protein
MAKYFPYIIHLPERKDRKIHIVNEIKKFTNDFYFIDGIRCTPPAIGISKVYRSLCEMANCYDMPEILTIEDDLLFYGINIMDRYQKAINDLPNDWDILLGGAAHFDSFTKYSDNLIKLNGMFCGLQFVLWNKKVYKTILNHKPESDTTQIKDIDCWLKHKNLNVYCVWPEIAGQIDNMSDNHAKNFSYSNYVNNRNLRLGINL